MADELEPQEGLTPEPQDNTPEPQEGGTPQAPAKEYTDVEKAAMEQGWVPEDEYQGSGKWRSAEEFLERGEFFSKIDHLKRQNESISSALNETKKHLARVRQTEYNRAVASLRAERKQAIAEGDGERVTQIEDAIARESRAAAQEIQQLAAPPQMPAAQDPVFMVWENRNPWYSQDRAMKIFADTIAEELVYKGITNPVELLNETERRVKKEFAHKFNNPNRSKPGAVEGVGGKGSVSKDNFQLTPEETQVMRKLVKHGVMTEKEYIADIKASRKG